MGKISAEQLRAALDECLTARLDLVEVFAEIKSTNSYLLEQTRPAPGQFRVALADQQTAGRGQLGKVWLSPRLSGLYLSVAYTFERLPRNVSSLTLAIGVAVIAGLKELGVTEVQLKWPNDLVLQDGKLGGILTELMPPVKDAVTVVVGIGLNLDAGGQLDAVVSSIGKVSDLRQVTTSAPDRLAIAAVTIKHLVQTLMDFAADGFASFYAQWKHYDWLEGKAIRVVTPLGNLDGIAAGIDGDGALLVKQGNTQQRVVSGTVTLLNNNGKTT